MQLVLTLVLVGGIAFLVWSTFLWQRAQHDWRSGTDGQSGAGATGTERRY